MGRGIITFEHKGDFKNLSKFLDKMSKGKISRQMLEVYGQRGVELLKAATPKDTGKTAHSWYYEIDIQPDSITISFNNSNVVDDWANVAILIQYGHATKGGGYVQGRDYINPAIQPLFDELAKDAWKEVSNV